MKLIALAIAVAAAGLTPVAAGAQAPSPAATATAPTTTTAPGADAGTNTATAAPAAAATPQAAPDPAFGMPNGGEGIQQQVTEVGRYAANFHNRWLLLLCAAISLMVLGLLAYTMVKFRRGANPTPSRTSHNTAIEVIWTLVPVLVLVAIAIPSMRLLQKQYMPPKADLTIKVIGNQWYWTYQYPDNGGFEIVSNMLKEKGDVPAGQRSRTDADGPKLLAADERLVLPQGKVVKFLVTSNDVIHAFWVPAFWSKIDANPGQINEIWVKADRPGVYYGQCTELCGARHAFMPIAAEVVPPDQFAAWVGSKGGTMPGAKPAAAPATATAGAPPVTGTPAAAQPTVAQPALNQATPAQN